MPPERIVPASPSVPAARRTRTPVAATTAALALLLLLSTFLKILFRLGLDAGFIRIFYDLREDERSRFAGTVALFSAAFASAAFALVGIFSAEVSRALFENTDGISWVRLVAADLLASSFVFVPFALLRIEGKALEGFYGALARDGTTAPQVDRMLTRKRLYELIGYADYEALDASIIRSVPPDTTG